MQIWKNNTFRFIIGITAGIAIAGLIIYKDSRNIPTVTEGEGEIVEPKTETSGPTILDANGNPVDVKTVSIAYPAILDELSDKAGAWKASGEGETILLKKIREKIALAKTNPESFNAWVDLGVYLKMFEKYGESLSVWKYLISTNGEVSLPYANAAVIEAYYMKNIPEGERLFTEALKRSNQPSLYFQVFEFYRDVKKDPVKAKATLEAGVKANPKDASLREVLQSL